MLIIRPIQDKSYQEQLCADCGVSYDPDCLAYFAEVDGKPVGICQFRMGETASIRDLRPVLGTDDWDAMFIMGRQTMNFIDLHGVHAATFDGEGEESFILYLGFHKNDEGRWYVNLEGFFDSPCKHAHHDGHAHGGGAK
ncbi:MAG: hypothetical protein IJ493_12485 [Clostridia bacterium]|nr:hypothetical protein [Clostridia bacterium]